MSRNLYEVKNYINNIIIFTNLIHNYCCVILKEETWWERRRFVKCSLGKQALPFFSSCMYLIDMNRLTLRILNTFLGFQATDVFMRKTQVYHSLEILHLKPALKIIKFMMVMEQSALFAAAVASFVWGSCFYKLVKTAAHFKENTKTPRYIRYSNVLFMLMGCFYYDCDS